MTDKAPKPFLEKLFLLRCKCAAITKSRLNDHFSSSYFDINDALAEVNPILQELRLLLIQPLRGNRVYSIIRDVDPDESGEIQEIDSYLDIPERVIADGNPQKMGSCTTYFRRYTLSSLLGMQAADDDGNAASGVGNEPFKKSFKAGAGSHRSRHAQNTIPAGSVAKPRQTPPPTPSPPAPGAKEWLNLTNAEGRYTRTYKEVTAAAIIGTVTKEEILERYKINTRDREILETIEFVTTSREEARANRKALKESSTPAQ